MLPEQWTQPCGNQCTQKFSALTQIPSILRVDADPKCVSGIEFNQWHGFSQGEYFARRAAALMGRHGKIFGSCSLGIYCAGVALRFYATGLHGFQVPLSLDECNEICYKDPVLKDRQWTAYIDRSPGSASYSEECFKACKAGCGYKFEIHPGEVDKARPNRPCNPPPSEKPPPVQKRPPQAVKHGEPTEDVPCTSA
ncbi:hypothetical protein POTOM_016828 [Populus tomentosa]|uniref:Uncharacterized protein n=1 Tax=Populus tomentosa TaxID=118781 RepID=A0A8X7ZW30_POPTO|nr:hypothetical protein POTOM_016828 [Populus tomentosa]